MLLSSAATPALPCMKEALLPISCFSIRNDSPKALPRISPGPSSPSPALLPVPKGHQLQTWPGVIVSRSPPPPLPHPSLLPHRCLSPAPSPPAVCFQVSSAQLRVCLFILRAGRRRRRRRARRAPQRPRRCCQHGAAPGEGRCSPAAQGTLTSGGLCCTTQTCATAQLASPPPPTLPCPSASFPQKPHGPPATQTRTGKAGPGAHPDLWPPLPLPPGLRLT